MKNRYSDRRGLTVDDLYEKESFDSFMDVIFAFIGLLWRVFIIILDRLKVMREIRKEKMENGASIWSFPSTWIKASVVVFFLVKIATFLIKS